MFLNPTANPTPRRTPSPRVVFPEPPGSRIGSRGSSSGSGSPSAAHRRITSATGSLPVITWPVGITSPDSSAFNNRSSIGSMSSAAASLSICASCAKQLCTAPNPRIAPHGGLFVYTHVLSTSAFSTLYGPHANADELPVTSRPVLRPDLRRMAMDVADERLLPRIDDLHRTVRVEREHRAV